MSSVCPVYRNGECGMGGGRCTWDPNKHSSCNVPHPGKYEATGNTRAECHDFLNQAPLPSPKNDKCNACGKPLTHFMTCPFCRHTRWGMIAFISAILFCCFGGPGLLLLLYNENSLAAVVIGSLSLSLGIVISLLVILSPKQVKSRIKWLIRSLNDEDDVKTMFSEALVRIGQPAVNLLIEALDNEIVRVRKKAIRVLGKINDPRAVEPLLAKLRDEKDTNVRTEVMNALSIIEAGKVDLLGQSTVACANDLPALNKVLQERAQNQEQQDRGSTRDVKPTSSDSKAQVPMAYKSVSSSEACAKADELGILAPGAIAAALRCEQKPESIIYVHGVITCVCKTPLPLEVGVIPGMSGGAPSVTCPDCGTRIAILEQVSGNTAVIAASIEAVKRQYQSSNIALILTGITEKQDA